MDLSLLEFIDCRACGQFEFLDSDKIANTSWQNSWHLLSAFIRRHNSVTGQPYLITDRVDGLLPARLVDPPVTRKISKTLLLIADRSRHFGDLVNVHLDFDWPLIEAYSPVELRHVTEHLVAEGLLREENRQAGKGAPFRFAVTASGWTEAERSKGARSSSRQAFVAMSFDSELNRAFELGIAPALSEAGYMPTRVDRQEHNEKICDKILLEIRKSSLLVADATKQKQGVYFEAGFALGLGIPVLWSCRNDDVDNLHFDTRQYNHIVWSTEEQLREALERRIGALYPIVAGQA